MTELNLLHAYIFTLRPVYCVQIIVFLALLCVMYAGMFVFALVLWTCETNQK